MKKSGLHKFLAAIVIVVIGSLLLWVNMHVFIFILFVMTLPLLLKYPEYCVYLLLLAMPLEGLTGSKEKNALLVTFPLTNTVIVFSLCIVVFTYLTRPAYFSNKWTHATKLTIACIFSLTLSQVLSALGAFDPDSTIRTTLTITVIALQTCMFIILIKDETVLRRVFTVLMLVSVFISVLNIMVAFEAVPYALASALGRLTRSRELGVFRMPFVGSAVLFDNRGTYGIFMHAILPLVLLAFLRGPTKFAYWKRIYTLPAFFVILAGIIVTQSRSSWAGTLLILFFMPLLYLSEMRISRKVIAATIIAMVTLYMLPGYFYSDVKNMSAASVDVRISGYRLAEKLFIDNPILGAGDSNQYFISDQGVILHNTFFTVLVNNGLVGFIPFMTIFFITFRRIVNMLRRSVDYDDRLLAASLFGTLIGISTESFFYQGYLVKNFWMVLALIFVSLNFLEVRKRNAQKTLNAVLRRNMEAHTG